MNHQQIRFEILQYLYNKFYSGFRYDSLSTDKLIEETEELQNIDKDIVYGDVVYLEDRRYISSSGESIGDNYPNFIRITSLGVDKVENIIDKIIEESAENSNESPNQEIKTISTKESDPKKKTERIWNYVKTNPSFFANTVEKIIRLFLSSG